MNDINKKTMALAARSVFAEMYNNKKDIYIVVAEYIVRLLASFDVTFTIDDIKDKLEIEYGFSIPQAVIKTAIKVILKKKLYGTDIIKNGITYSIIKYPNKFDDAIDEKNSYLKNNLLYPLFDYIYERIKKQLSENEKNKIETELCLYLLDKSIEGDYSNLISGYLVSKEQDEEFKKSLSFVREGVILETGLKYTGEPSISQYKDCKLDIFLDTEILFSASGLNGIVFKNLFDSFYEQVDAVNKETQRKFKNKYIYLYYTGDVEEEICNYFKRAEKSIELNQIDPFPKEAMRNILNKCKTSDAVVSMKVDFFKYINKKHINLYSEKYNKENEKQYNYAYKENIDEIKKDFELSDADAYKHLCIVSFINKLRKDFSIKNIDLSRYIYVTGKNIRLSVAKKYVEKDGCVAITSLDWLTNIFWYRLNKGVLNEKRPLSFDAVTKAKILFASERDESITRRYNDFIKDRNDLMEDEISAYVYELKQGCVRVDEINSENIDVIQDTYFANESFEDFEKRKKQEALERRKEQKELEELREYREKVETDKLIRCQRKKIVKKSCIFIAFFCGLIVAYQSNVWNTSLMQFLVVVFALFSAFPLFRKAKKWLINL